MDNTTTNSAAGKTSKQLKVAIVYGETPENMTPEEQFRFNAFSALWEEMKSAFINDEDIEPDYEATMREVNKRN